MIKCFCIEFGVYMEPECVLCERVKEIGSLQKVDMEKNKQNELDSEDAQ